jgi:hypothetical protein
MFLIALPLLLLVLAVAHDMGNVAAGAVIAQNAADTAAYEAGMYIDIPRFAQWQEIRLRPQAGMVAQQTADRMTNGAFRIDAVTVEETMVVVEGRVSVRTPFMNAFLGIPHLTRRVQGVAEAAHGIERCGE